MCEIPLPIGTYCSFCSCSFDDRKYLLKGKSASICNNCIEYMIVRLLPSVSLESFNKIMSEKQD